MKAKLEWTKLVDVGIGSEAAVEANAEVGSVMTATKGTADAQRRRPVRQSLTHSEPSD
jgi:hypothetical protein